MAGKGPGLKRMTVGNYVQVETLAARRPHGPSHITNGEKAGPELEDEKEQETKARGERCGGYTSVAQPWKAEYLGWPTYICTEEDYWDDGPHQAASSLKLFFLPKEWAGWRHAPFVMEWSHRVVGAGRVSRRVMGRGVQQGAQLVVATQV